MTHLKLTFLTTIAASTLLFAGCTTTSTTNTNTAVTNATANTNVVVANTNTANTNLTNTNSTNTVVVTNDNSNENTNVDQGTDTSDWLTYTNDEYGFSFKYPSDWSVNNKSSDYIQITSNPTQNNKTPSEGSSVIDINFYSTFNKVPYLKSSNYKSDLTTALDQRLISDLQMTKDTYAVFTTYNSALDEYDIMHYFINGAKISVLSYAKGSEYMTIIQAIINSIKY